MTESLSTAPPHGGDAADAADSDAAAAHGGRGAAAGMAGAHDALAGLAQAVDALGAAPSSATGSAAEQAAEVRALWTELQRVHAQLVGRIAEADAHATWREDGYASTAGWLRGACDLPNSAARQHASVARLLRRLPRFREAFERGEITWAHVRDLARAAAGDRAAHAEADEPILIRAALRLDASRFRRLLEHWEHAVDPDGVADEEERLRARRRLHLVDGPLGNIVVHGELTQEGGEVVRSALDAVQRRTLSADDRRRTSQRQADALVELARVALDSGALGDAGGRRPHVTVVADLETLEARAGAPAAETERGVRLSARTLRRLACDASVARVVRDPAGEPIDLGRATPTVSTAQRRALHVRDGGCRAPGCDAPASWTDAHHVRFWADHDGPTDLDNLVLLCRRHHTAVHDGRLDIQRLDPPRGLPWDALDGAGLDGASPESAGLESAGDVAREPPGAYDPRPPPGHSMRLNTSNIGMYNAMTMAPTRPPRTRIINGSSIAVSDSVVAATSSS